MFKVTLGAVVVHGLRVVVIEQREGSGRVRVRDRAIGSQTTALIAALRARESETRNRAVRPSRSANRRVARARSARQIPSRYSCY